MRPLEWMDDPKFNGIYFRREYDQLRGAGGLWEIASKYYPQFGAKPNLSQLNYTFPSGARCRFKHMFTEADAEKHRGLQYSFIGIDEITQFSATQVQFILTCLRSEANMNSFCIGTLNPDPTSWCLDLIKWYLDDDGYPDPDKQGVIRYFIVLDGKFIFGDTEEYFQENYPDSVYINIPSTGERRYIPPKTFTFIQLTIFDNPILLELNPRYLSELQNLPDHERERQLYGNWYAMPQGANYWRREWIRGENGERVLSSLPNDVTLCARAYDKAGSEPSQTYRYRIAA